MNKLCRNCANARAIGSSWDCHAEQNMIDDLVRGGRKDKFPCDYLRGSENHCGSEAKWFSSRAVTVAK